MAEAREEKKQVYKPTAKETKTQVIKFVLFSISAGIIETATFTVLDLITS
jgi:hypothetical protein